MTSPGVDPPLLWTSHALVCQKDQSRVSPMDCEGHACTDSADAGAAEEHPGTNNSAMIHDVNAG
jgi:hypothetical protein